MWCPPPMRWRWRWPEECSASGAWRLLGGPSVIASGHVPSEGARRPVSGAISSTGGGDATPWSVSNGTKPVSNGTKPVLRPRRAAGGAPQVRRVASARRVPLLSPQRPGDAVAAFQHQAAQRCRIPGIGEPGVGGGERALLHDRWEQVLDGVLRDLAGAPVPQRADLGEVPLDVAGGQLTLGGVPEAGEHR